jgi:hypothetical protein
MESKEAVQEAVRRRDRFQCVYCGKPGEQYAHIVPDSDGGEYALDNLIFLCYSCHKNSQEAAGAPLEMKARLIELSQRMRDSEKVDNVLSSIFKWPAGEQLAVTLGGGMRAVNQERILERGDNPARPYLTLSIDKFGALIINAYFDDAEGSDFMQISDNRMKVHSAVAWDIVISRRSIKFEHIDRKIRLQIRQAPNMDLRVTGNLYLNGSYYEITEDAILDVTNNNFLQGNRTMGNGRGLLLSSTEMSF